MSRAARLAYWTVPSLFCLAIYWLGLKAWFRQDDFAWLTLNLRLRETGDLWGILFAPQAQGTIRPLSERLFFLMFHGIFGLNAVPFRITVFLTQFANLVLVSSITWRITRSRAAGFWAPVLWVSNSALVAVMSWTSAYNQALCAFFLLASFQLFLWHIETGKLRYYVWQWVTFLLGFGALEIIVVYPAIAATYALLCAPRVFSPDAMAVRAVGRLRGSVLALGSQTSWRRLRPALGREHADDVRALLGMGPVSLAPRPLAG